MLLVGALAFLIIAVTLTFLFTPSSGPQAGQVAQTSSANALTPVGGEGISTPVTVEPGGPYPSSDATTVSGYPEPSAVGDSGTDAYPSLEIETSAADAVAAAQGETSTANAEQTITASASLEGETALALDSPTPEDDNPYPEPEGTPPPAPTFNPAVTTATSPSQGATSAPAGGQQPASTPTFAPSPTVALPPTSPPFVPTSPPPPTDIPAQPKEPPPTSPPAPVVPTSPPVDVLRGNVRWSTGESPITLHNDVQLAPGAELIIEPGVEVRIDPGVSIYVDGARLLALGLPGQPVRFVGSTRARWSGIFGRPGSFIVMENTEVRGGGAGGTVMAVDSSELVVRSSRIDDNGGGILVTDTKLEVKDTEIAGNDVPFGAALDGSYARGTYVTLQHNRIGGNRLSDGAPMVRFANQSTFSTLILDISGNLFRGGTPNLQLITNGPLQGGVTCNALIGEGQGFGLRTQTPQVNPNGVPPLGLSFTNNFLDEHIPPVIPVYLKYGLGRGATSEVLIDMRDNWWGEASGPYEPDANPDGRGDSVGSNILFIPWQTQPPPCAPSK
ncbi:hypothetical protein [Oscillochloris sp. ZM17-4]|uniref:right-handed parallel beta-helix repeat-containing protein n=1 Tax=Oscillochloris sp. ZM17-4 TaxID=2866714 RepID=UPI0021028A9A|nr:hypothetical protein [Oscillochloris sp. ZM17-4]